MLTPQPLYPLISIYKDKGLHIVRDASKLSKVSVFTLLKQNPEDCIYYDTHGNKWVCLFSSAEFKNTFFTRLLANTFYNPTYTAVQNWTSRGAYALNELQDAIKACIDADDDIITQFAEAEDIKPAITKASTFEEIVQALDKFVFNVDEEALWKEFGKDV